jgi:[ribosomal protein S5]-alanine N-acetyltransferase
MQLATPRLVLREFRRDDYSAVREYTRDPEIHRFESETIPDDDSIHAYLEQAVESAQQQPRRKYLLAVSLPPSNQAIGRISLTLNFAEWREWEIGWTIRRECWGQGYATEAAREMTRFAFDDLNIHRLVAFCNANNTASWRVMVKLGMKRDGVLRETRQWQGGWCDEFIYSLLDREYKRIV